MKRIILLLLLVNCLMLSACTGDNSIGIIGGADGPTAILVGEYNGTVKGQFGEQYEKKPIRMFNVDGELYYDSGLVSDMTPRCGTLDGELAPGFYRLSKEIMDFREAGDYDSKTYYAEFVIKE